MEERLRNLKMSSGQSATSLTARRDSSASTSSGVRSSLTPDSQSLNQHLTSSVEDMEEQQYLDLMQTLRAEHQSIESELRDLMAIPSKLRSAAQIAREERLMKDLMENVKRRDELEDEDDESELQKTLGDAGNPGGQPKKMKKKGKFKIKKLLGVK
jgi:heme oxygenase